MMDSGWGRGWGEIISGYGWWVWENYFGAGFWERILKLLDDQLFIVDFVPKKHLNIYKMDFDAIKRIKVDDLGDKANIQKW